MPDRIEQLLRRCAGDPSVVPLAGGLPSPTLFPRRALAAAASRALRRDGPSALQYTWPEGREGLRTWIARWLAARGAEVSPDEVLVTSGAQQALAIAAELLVADGGTARFDPETYPGALDVFRGRGARVVVGPARARCAYAMPALSNPRSRKADAVARRALLARAQYVVEDDAYAQLRFSGKTPPSMLAEAPGRVFHVGTFSKVLCPGVRVGWLVVPRAFRERALEAKRIGDLQSNGLAQSVMEEFLARCDLDRRLVLARRYYARKAERLCAALRRELPEFAFTDPEGGFSIWLEGPEPGDDAALLEHAVAQGVCFDPGRGFRAAPSPRDPLAFRVSYSLAPIEQLEEGARRLRRAFRAYRRAARAA